MSVLMVLLCLHPLRFNSASEIICAIRATLCLGQIYSLCQNIRLNVSYLIFQAVVLHQADVERRRPALGPLQHQTHSLAGLG